MAIPKKQAALTTLQNRQASGQTLGAKQQARVDKLDNRFNGQLTPPPTGGGVKTAPVVGTQTGKGFQLGTTLADLEAQKAGLKGKNRIAQVDQAIAGLQPSAPATTTPAATTTPDIVDNGMGDESSSRGNDDIGNALFPSMRAFEPENYQGSPLYDFQQKQGEKRINATLAKRGLLDSGAEIQAISDFNTELGAVEADKTRGYAQNEADRLERIQQNESLRQERGANRSGDDLYRWTDMMLRQNPMDYAFSGTEKAAGNIGDSSTAMANYLKDRYQRSFPSGGGGGGGGAYVPPFPGAPDFSEIDRLGYLGNGASDTGYWNSIKNTIAGLF